MLAPKHLLITTALLCAVSARADEHFPLPSTGPATQVNSGSFATNEQAPTTCDASTIQWMKDWRQRARMGYVTTVSKYIPSLANGAKCIDDPEARDVQYVASGDYFIASCLAASNGTLSHFFKFDISVPVDQTCLGDSRFSDYVNKNHCRIAGPAGSPPPAARAPLPFPGMAPGGVAQANGRVNDNQIFLDAVMKTCAVTPPHSPVLRDSPQAYPIDVSYFARILAARPEIKGIVDEHTMRVKSGGTNLTVGPKVGKDSDDGDDGDDTDGNSPTPSKICEDASNPLCNTGSAK